MPVSKLKQYLDDNEIKFVTVSHSAAYTAQEVAAVAHISGKELAKTVMVKVNGELAMAVLPASQYVDFEVLAEAAGGATVEMAGEEEFESRFPDCEMGAMPPFGNLYDMNVYLSPALAEDEEVAFNAGSHTELVKLKYSDYERLVEPAIVKLPR